MDIVSLAGLLLLAGVAAYVQSLTGFAFGLLMMGGIGMMGLVPLPDAAVIVGILTLVNATQVLSRGWRDVAWRDFEAPVRKAVKRASPICVVKASCRACRAAVSSTVTQGAGDRPARRTP